MNKSNLNENTAKRLKRDLRTIKKITKEQNIFHGGELSSVLDIGRGAYLSLVSHKSLCGADTTKEAYDFSYRCFESVAACDEKELALMAEQYEIARGSCFGYGDYLAFIPCAISSLVSMIRQLCECRECDKAIRDKRLYECIFTIRILSFASPNALFANTSYEKMFLCDPSGAFPRMTAESREALRRSLCLAAKKDNISEKKLLSKIIKKAENGASPREQYIGYHLERDKKKEKFLYFLLIAVLTVIPSLIFLPEPLAIIFSIFPFYAVAKSIVCRAFSFFSKCSAPIPEIELREIPDDAPTLCVITALLSEREDGELFSRLEKIYNGNSGKNVRFGLLCDLCDNDSATKSTDEKVVAYASGRIASLNAKYGNSFMLFVRRRSYSKSERCFMPYERKRGAVIELVRLIKGEQTGFDLSGEGICANAEFIKNIRYVVTLDSDTEVSVSCVTRLVGKMLHPMNTPYFDKEKKRVTKGYGIMQPRMLPTLSSSRKTRFSSIMCKNSGFELYAGAGFELYQSIFSRGMFCGKGIFDTGAFYSAIVCGGFFPDDAVLSHDIPEGELLGTAAVGDIVFYDSFPKNTLSYFKRQHRWIRGDVQNLIFVERNIGRKEKKVRNPLPPISKYKLIDAVVSSLVPVFSLMLIIIAAICEKKIPLLVLTAFLPYIFPLFADIVSFFVSGNTKAFARVFFSSGISNPLIFIVKNTAFNCCFLCKNALLSAGAFMTSLFRMIFTKKHLLEWVTSAQSDSGKATLPCFISKNIFPSILGALIFVVSRDGLLRLCGILFFVCPLVGYYTSKSRRRTKKRRDDGAIFHSYAKDIWRFFSENVGESTSNLPPDHIRTYGGHTVEYKTSPTNIGLYLLSVLCARDFGFIRTHELVKRLSDSLFSIEKMAKWHGNLYNWYDTRDLSLMPPYFVSSVDSGNFIGCLVALKNGLAEYADDDPETIHIIRRISDIIDSCDLSYLYNRGRGLFSIGVHALPWKSTQDPSCYDYLMSESRILSYLAVARRQVPVSHWSHLSRPLVEKDGRIGLFSWSGTAFEYYMPALFMPTHEGSLIFEALKFSHHAQKQKNAHGIYGSSESGYHAFDENGGYLYRAFGAPILAKDPNFGSELVFSPYSSFLSLCVNTQESLSNLAALRSIGAYGEYGFYEAVDFSHIKHDGRCGIVKSYMSHHMGMSMCALTNAAYGNNLVGRFMKEPICRCAESLLEEKIPISSAIYDFDRK